MPDSTLYKGKVYDIGNVVPNYVDNVEVPHIWYDQSRSYKGQTNIFNELIISEGMLLGDSEDDMWTIEEILEEILKYLNLHIVQHGFDYYIFDWETSRIQKNDLIYQKINASFDKGKLVLLLELLASKSR